MSQPSQQGRATRTESHSRSIVWFTHIDTSGCGACTQSVFGLLAPHYAGRLRAEGISMTRSPRHADIILISGALTRAARIPALRVLLAAPEPHALVAIGDCAINGCVFQGSPLLAQSVAETLDVNIELPGCPPTPEAILAAIIEAKRLLLGEASVADEATANAADEDTDEDTGEAEDSEEGVAADEEDGEEESGEPSDEDDETPADDEGDVADETGDEHDNEKGGQV